MVKKRIWATTVDNPYNYFKQFNRWYRFDENSGYHTCSRIARLAATSNKLTDEENEAAIEAAVIALCEWYEPYNVYRVVVEGEGETFGFPDPE